MAWAGGISWTRLVCCVRTPSVVDTNKYPVRNCEKYLCICWAVGLRECCALTRRCWNCHVSALNGLRRVLKSWTYANGFKTQPGQSLWVGKRTYAWKPINIITPYDAFLAFFFVYLLPATVGNGILGNITLSSDVALTTTTKKGWIHCDFQNLKTTTQLKNQPVKTPDLYSS